MVQPVLLWMRTRRFRPSRDWIGALAVTAVTATARSGVAEVAEAAAAVEARAARIKAARAMVLCTLISFLPETSPPAGLFPIYYNQCSPKSPLMLHRRICP